MDKRVVLYMKVEIQQRNNADDDCGEWTHHTDITESFSRSGAFTEEFTEISRRKLGANAEKLVALIQSKASELTDGW